MNQNRQQGIPPIPTLDQLWISLPFFLLILKSFIFPLPLLDFWWHLKMGQVILNTGSIPRFDIFSYTAAGKLFVIQNWLAEILFYVTYRTGGFALLILLNTVLLIGVLIPIYHLCRKYSKSLWASVFAVSLVAACITCNMRPQVFSFLFFAFFYWLLSSYCTGERDWIYWLPALMILWVNFHGAFVLGLALIVCFVVSESVRAFADRSSQDALSRKKILRLALVLILCAIATLANPETYSVFRYIRTVVEDPSSQQFVLEWQPPAIGSVQGFVQFYLPFFLTTLVLIVSERRPSLTELVLYTAFSTVGMTATRNSIWFLLISAPILARHLPLVHWAGLLSLRRIRQASGLPASNQQSKRQYPLLNCLIAGMAVVLVSIQSPWVQHSVYGSSLLDAKTPVGAMDFISKHPLEGNIFHPQIYGDYLIWRLWPKQRVFFDGRVHLYGESLVKTYQRIYSEPGWEELLGEYRIRYLLLSKQEEKADKKGLIDKVRASHHWVLLYEDSASILWEKAADKPLELRP